MRSPQRGKWFVSYTLTAALAASSYGCSIRSQTEVPSTRITPLETKRIEAMPVLGATHISQVYTLPGEWLTHQRDVKKLELLAGFIAGTVSAYKTNRGFTFSGDYSYAKHPTAMVEVCMKADSDEDSTVTTDEIDAEVTKLYKRLEMKHHMNLLEVKYPFEVDTLPNGYLVAKQDKDHLLSLAGKLSGGIAFIEKERKVYQKGEFDLERDCVDLERMCSHIDQNEDDALSVTEVREFWARLAKGIRRHMQEE